MASCWSWLALQGRCSNNVTTSSYILPSNSTESSWRHLQWDSCNLQACTVYTTYTTLQRSRLVAVITGRVTRPCARLTDREAHKGSRREWVGKEGSPLEGRLGTNRRPNRRPPNQLVSTGIMGRNYLPLHSNACQGGSPTRSSQPRLHLQGRSIGLGGGRLCT